MKIDFNVQKNKWIKLVSLWIILVLVLKILTMMQMPMMLTNIVFVSVSFALVVTSYINNQENKWELSIFVLAYLAHLLVLILDLYGREYVMILHSGRDTEMFFKISEQYFHGDFSETVTYYPYYLNAFYKIIGLNRFGAQYINVLGWCFSMILMEKSCKVLEIEGKLRVFGLLLMAFAPNYMCITSVLLREGIIITMNFLWFYCQIMWMKEGNRAYLVGCLIAPLVSLGLHMSAIVFWGLTIFAVALYDSKKKQFRIQKKTMITLLIGLVGILVFLLIPNTRRLITQKLPDFDEGFLNTINEMITFASENDGGSSYLKDVYVTGYGDFVMQTFVRIFYFYASPLPLHWRGLSDAAAFVISSAPYLLSLILSFITVFIRKKDSYRTLMWGAFLLLGGICSWGVFNAGTAMRHRDKIIGIAILLLLYSLNIIKKAWKSKGEKNEW